jgi:Transposase family tnp2
MKRKYMMMTLLISNPKQLGNNIDVYLAPLIEDLVRLRKDGVEVFDSHSKTKFTLRVMVFCMINDFSALSNLSGFRNKGEKACPICGENTHSLWLKNYRKTIYLGHRRFLLQRDHPYRKNKMAFDGTVEEGIAPMPLTGRQVHEVVKGIKNVTFGKKFQNSIPDGLWKKKSIF